MGALLDNIDPNGLEEFSVVFTDRSLNHMSSSFQQVMNDISSMLKEVYRSDAVVIVPSMSKASAEGFGLRRGSGWLIVLSLRGARFQDVAAAASLHV